MKKFHYYKVWLEQVNAACIEVKAKSIDEAKEKAHKEWKKHYADTYVTAVECQDERTKP